MQAGGIFLTFGLLIGAAVGVHYGEGSLGMVIGLVAGLIAVGLFAWWDKRRRARGDRPR